MPIWTFKIHYGGTERGAFLSFTVIMHNTMHMKDLNAYLQNLNEPALGKHYLTSKTVFVENTISTPAVEPPLAISI